MDTDYDTDAAGILIGNDCDAITAMAAAYRPQASKSPSSAANGRFAFNAGLLIGLVLFVLWLLWK